MTYYFIATCSNYLNTTTPYSETDEKRQTFILTCKAYTTVMASLFGLQDKGITQYPL